MTGKTCAVCSVCGAACGTTSTLCAAHEPARGELCRICDDPAVLRDTCLVPYCAHHDPRRTKAAPASKADDGKDPWELLPFEAVRDVVRVLAFGARKYAPDAWRSVPDARQRYFAAAMRHLVAWWGGERCDAESGLPNLAHAVCCLLFLASRDAEGGR